MGQWEWGQWEHHCCQTIQDLLCRGAVMLTLARVWSKGYFTFRLLFAIFFFFSPLCRLALMNTRCFSNCFFRISAWQLKEKKSVNTYSINFKLHIWPFRSEAHNPLVVEWEVCSWWSARWTCPLSPTWSDLWQSSDPWALADWSKLHLQHSKMICCGLPFAWRWHKSSRWWRRRWKCGHVVCT